MCTSLFEAALAVYAVFGVATYLLMANYRNDMKNVLTVDQAEQVGLSFDKYLIALVTGFVLIVMFWPLMAFHSFTTWKKS